MIWLQLSSTQAANAMNALQGARVLLIEDDFLVALSIKQMLEEIGCTVVGPYATAEQANEALDGSDIDFGVLDINIRDGTSVPVANALRARSRPFIFVTGYRSPNIMLPDDLRSAKRLSKPVNSKMLRTALLDEMR